MAQPQASGLAARALAREEARARVRRARRVAAGAVLAFVALVVLLLTAFGSAPGDGVRPAGPAPAQRLLPPGPPRPEVVAMVEDSLPLLLPVSQSRITAVGYHASGSGALPLEPVGSQANAGLVERLLRKLFGRSSSGLPYYLLDGGVGPRTGGLDVGAPVGTDVYAPVDGTVIAVADYVVNGRPFGVRIEIQPSGSPGVVVSISNLRPDPALTVGSTVSAARTKIGSVIDLSSVERARLAEYTQDEGQHVHIEVHPATSLAAP